MMAGQETATLYLRGVPRKLVREAKAEAARRGMTLTAFAKEALARALGRASEEDEDAIRPIRPDLDWFEANRTRLHRRYPNEYLAIISRKVVDHDVSFEALARRVFAKYGLKSIAMPKATAEEEVVNIPTPWLSPP